MPSGCSSCPIYDGEYGECQLRTCFPSRFANVHALFDDRPNNCPLVQMIHCKDCEYYKTPQKYSYKEPNPYCCRSALVKMSENDFCSRAIRKGGEDMPKSPSQDCMKRGEKVCEWIMQGMKEADEWIKENGKNPYADILLEKEGEKE